MLWRLPVPVPVPDLLDAVESALELVPATEPVPEPVVVSDNVADVIREAKALGMSNNKIATLLRGNRAAALEMIRQALGNQSEVVDER